MAKSGPRAQLQVLQNSGSQMLMLSVKPCKIATDEIQSKKSTLESTAI